MLYYFDMEKKLNEIFSARLKEAMMEKGVKQVEIIDSLGLNKGAMSSYLSGRYMPKNETMMKMAMMLEVSPAWLSGFDVAKHPVGNEENDFQDFLPYLARASQQTLDIIRKILDMPGKGDADTSRSGMKEAL